MKKAMALAVGVHGRIVFNRARDLGVTLRFAIGSVYHNASPVALKNRQSRSRPDSIVNSNKLVESKRRDSRVPCPALLQPTTTNTLDQMAESRRSRARDLLKRRGEIHNTIAMLKVSISCIEDTIDEAEAEEKNVEDLQVRLECEQTEVMAQEVKQDELEGEMEEFADVVSVVMLKGGMLGLTRCCYRFARLRRRKRRKRKRRRRRTRLDVAFRRNGIKIEALGESKWSGKKTRLDDPAG